MAEMNRTLICVDDEVDIVSAYADVLTPVPVAVAKQSSRSAAPTSSPSPTAQAEYRLLKANSGESAIELVKKELAEKRRVAGGFFDVKMEGGIDGIQTIQELWKLDPGMHVTIVTAYQDRSVADIDQLFGPSFKDQWDYLNKPFSHGEIQQKARQMVAAWNRKRHLEDALVALKNAQEQLICNERLAAIGQVARGVGHEFGNILQRMIGKADLALHETDVAKIHEGLKVLIQAAESGSVIIRNLQSFSKGSATKSAIDPTKVINDTLSLIKHEFVKASITVDCKLASDGLIHANAVGLQQVLMNLMINAIHATPKGGKLVIRSERDPKDKALLISVTDTGTGIAPELLPKIFEYAFTTKGDKGSGLGLSISKQIVEEHGGTLSVKSTVGQGTSFTIRIPEGA